MWRCLWRRGRQVGTSRCAWWLCRWDTDADTGPPVREVWGVNRTQGRCRTRLLYGRGVAHTGCADWTPTTRKKDWRYSIHVHLCDSLRRQTRWKSWRGACRMSLTGHLRGHTIPDGHPLPRRGAEKVVGEVTVLTYNMGQELSTHWPQCTTCENVEKALGTATYDMVCISESFWR